MHAEGMVDGALVARLDLYSILCGSNRAPAPLCCGRTGSPTITAAAAAGAEEAAAEACPVPVLALALS
eukprot:7569829-Prorocentrum_lima.AAC.1